MRVKRRLAIYFGLGLLLLGGRQSVQAQSQPGVFQLNGSSPPPANGSMPAPGPTFNGPAAPPSSFNGSLAAQEYSSYPSVVPVVPPNLPPETYGPTVNPWPTVSPFDYSFQSDRNIGGIWEHVERTRGRQWYFNSDFLWMSTKPQQGIFGNPNAQTYVRQERDFINSTNGSSGSSSGSGSGSGSSSSTTSAAQNQLLQDQGFIVDTPAYFASLANYYNALDLGTLGNLITEGGRFQVGFWNPDNSGFDARFWFGGQASDNFNAADDETQRPKDLAGFEQILRFLQNNNIVNLGLAGQSLDLIEGVDPAFNGTKFSPTQLFSLDLQNLRGLPVADNTARGQTIPYDIYFDVKTTSQQIGTNLDYYFTPVFERKWLVVNPSVGVTYMNVKESLGFLGIDSGLLYSPSTTTSSSGGSGSSTTSGALRDYKAQSFPNGIDDNQDGIIDNAGSPESGPSSSSSGSSGSSGGSSSSSSGSTTFGITAPTPFTLLPATLDISTTSNIVGPTAGLRYLIGGKAFHIIGETKFGVMADFEQIALSGNNIGSTTRINGNPVTFQPEAFNTVHGNVEYQQDLIIPTPANPNPNTFSSSETHAHVSPYFEQSFTAEAPILQWVPYVNKISILSKAQFRLGYQFIWIGNVINTNQSVDYEGDPMAGMFPTIQPTHSGWWTQNGSVGVSWQW
jgi:hypothetical protein